MVTVCLKCFSEIEKVLILGVENVCRKPMPGLELNCPEWVCPGEKHFVFSRTSSVLPMISDAHQGARIPQDTVMVSHPAECWRSLGKSSWVLLDFWHWFSMALRRKGLWRRPVKAEVLGSGDSARQNLAGDRGNNFVLYLPSFLPSVLTVSSGLHIATHIQLEWNH